MKMTDEKRKVVAEQINAILHQHSYDDVEYGGRNVADGRWDDVCDDIIEMIEEEKF
jgi:hypothetical protein